MPTAGGCNLGGPAGPRDQTAVEERHDVLVFTSDRLERELESDRAGQGRPLRGRAPPPTPTGRPSSSTCGPTGAPSTSATASCAPAAANRPKRPKLIEPGKVYRYEIDLWVTSNVFLPGHRIRVEISSSNFPRFDRNPNTGHAFGADAERRKATQTVYHDAANASHILLPVIP